MDAETVITWIERLGLPTAFLVGVLVIMWLMLRAVWMAVKPFIEPAFKRLVGMIDTIEASQETIVKTQETQSQLLAAIATDGKTRAQQIEEIFENLINAAERLLPPDLRKEVEFHLQAARRALRGG